MNLKRILSAALMVVMVFTAVICALPITSYAAHSSSSVGSTLNSLYPEADLDKEELDAYLAEYLKYDYSSSAQMLSDELVAGYLYSVDSANKLYTMFVNKYTGFLYYVNNLTGQILTSNPINVGYIGVTGSPSIEEGYRQELMSQISIKFFESANSQNKYDYNSYRWSALRSQLSVTPINGGLRVNYTLGDTTARFLLPGQITATDFENDIMIPLIEKYEELLVTYFGDEYEEEELSFFKNDKYNHYFEYGSAEYGGINMQSGKSNGLRTFLSDTKKIFDKLPAGSAERRAMDELYSNINTIIGAYVLQAPSRFIMAIEEKGEDKAQSEVSRLEKMYEKYPVTKPTTDDPNDYGTAIYAYSGSQEVAVMRSTSEIIKKHVPTYTFAMMYEDESDCGYVDNSPQKPVFRCALEYTFNDDGSLSVRLPANSITFDETVYTLESIAPLKFFGCGDMKEGGYIFYPDGSGTIVEFDDFYNEATGKKTAISLISEIYGKDYCYSEISGAHRSQITMPVFGLVANVNANAQSAAISGKDKVTNGYFAVIEEGESLANLALYSGGSSHRYATSYVSYNPYPSDKYDLSETLSVGALGEYIIVSDSKYSGSYITRYVMLSDEEIGNAVYGDGNYYKSTYVGMASYYRDFLKENGVLTALEIVSEDLPLYVESLGSMQILDKFLTFPVNKDIALTTFEDVMTMYEELSQCSEYVKLKAEECRKLAEAEEDEGQKYQYIKKAETYEALIGKIEDISNINFKLTGFANGGMNFTYPVRAKWMSVCGGTRGFNKLLDYTVSESAKDGVSFGIFPEFDFMYIYNSSTFDGIGTKGNVARMVDNRYASKQVYDSVSQEYNRLERQENFFTLVITADALDRLFTKFERQYDKYGIKSISVSTLGSDLNSNFDEDAPINRDEAQDYVTQLLDRMVNENEYQLMVDKGNMYSLKYATHILNMSIDSSHFRFSSYAIPFTGLILHSYVNYTGSPINYSGNIDYDLLRAIENGASIHYILCYQNTLYLKDDENLSQYYGVDYDNWYASILETYTELNSQIGGLQDYEIVDHTVLIAERVINEREMAENYKRLQEEVLVLLDKQIEKAINVAFDELAGDSGNYSKRVKVHFTDEDINSLVEQFAGILNITSDEIKASAFMTQIKSVIAKYESEYPGAENAEDCYVVSFGAIEYSSQYSYITDSFAQDKDYVYTDYTNDNGNVVMVTYKKGDSVVKFILNYNIYSVTVRLDADHVYTIGGTSYQKIVE